MQVPSLDWEDPPGGGNGNPPQYSCLKNSIDRGAQWAIVHGAAKSWTWLSTTQVSILFAEFPATFTAD